MRIYRSIFLIVLISVLFFSCNESPVENDNDNNDDTNFEPGRRDYVWTVDTLSNLAPYNDYHAIWGMSPKNLWVISYSGDGNKSILHFENNEWEIYNYQTPGQWILGWSIYGNSEEEFWIGDSEGKIFNFHNEVVTKYGPFTKSGFLDLVLYKFIDAPNNQLYVVGGSLKKDEQKYYSNILKFNGENWKYIINPEEKGIFFDIKRGIKDSENYYLLSWESIEDDSIGIYEFDGQKIKLIKTFGRESHTEIYSANGHIYFYFDKKMHQYINDEFRLMKDLSNSKAIGREIYGRSINDFFISTEDGIGHYNGNNLKTIFSLGFPSWIMNAIVFENDIFLLLTDQNHKKYYGVRGTLK